MSLEGLLHVLRLAKGFILGASAISFAAGCLAMLLFLRGCG